jgi:Putative peptidoglycan binding domain.
VSDETDVGRAPRKFGWRVATVAIVVAPLVALWAGTKISSPAQRAADAAPPTASYILVRAQNRVLEDTTVVPGKVVAGRSVDVTASAAGDLKPIVSGATLAVGSTVHEGDVVVVISGRPVIAFGGAVSAYRDLRPGLAGADVAQLQASLNRLGYNTRDISGSFGSGTQSAIQRLYADRGFIPVPTSNDFASGISDASDALQAANAALAQARQTPGADTSGPAAAVGHALRQYDQLVATTGMTLPASETVFVPEFPATLTASRAQVGQDASSTGTANSPLMTISSGSAIVKMLIPPDAAKLVRPGTTATVLADSGAPFPATVFQVGDQVENDGNGGSGIAAVVVGNVALPGALIGHDVTVTINARVSTGTVLAVPVSAVYSKADGSTKVSRMVGNRVQDVPVRAGATAGGYVEVQPVQLGQLRVGDNVIVGGQLGKATSP